MKTKVFKKAVVVKDEHGLPNYMTMYYLDCDEAEPVPEETPDIFKVGGKIVPAVLISQFANAMIREIPVSLPYQQPANCINYTKAAEFCRKKGQGWHLLTNAEFNFLLEEAEKIGHTIGGNTNYGENADNPEQKGVKYDNGRTLTGLDPLAWSNDGTENGVFGLCGNFWEWVLGLRLHKGAIEYIKDNDAAAVVHGPEDKAWTVTTYNGKTLRMGGGDGVVLTDEELEEDWDGCHMAELELAGTLKEVPEILHKLGVIPKNWKNEKAGIWADSELKEAVPLRGSSFGNASNGGAGALNLNGARSIVSNDVSFRSALYLEDWKLVAELLGRV